MQDKDSLEDEEREIYYKKYMKQIDEENDKPLNKPFRLSGDDKKKFGVYVKNEKGNVVLIKFGDKSLSIKTQNDDRRKAFRARHGCDDADNNDRTSARYWSCRMWSSRDAVSKMLDEEGNYEGSKELVDKYKKETPGQIAEEDPCWNDYVQIGTKKKNGKTVPNCVPKK